MYTLHKQLRSPGRVRWPLRRGFTLIEVLIVVLLLGILSAVVVPMFGASNRESQDNVYMTNSRYACRAFQYYHFENGAYPPDRNPTQMPVGMDQLLSGMDWAGTTPIGGTWDWDYGVFGVTAGVSAKSPDRTAAEMSEIDAMIDDGNLSTGGYRQRTGGYIMIIKD